jgi:hypothetical protein
MMNKFGSNSTLRQSNPSFEASIISHNDAHCFVVEPRQQRRHYPQHLILADPPDPVPSDSIDKHNNNQGYVNLRGSNRLELK